jgi:hypothetical protein
LSAAKLQTISFLSAAKTTLFVGLCALVFGVFACSKFAGSTTPWGTSLAPGADSRSGNTGQGNGEPSLSAEFQPELVSYPNPEIAFICGPQLKAGSRFNPFPWFDRAQIESGHVHGRWFPAIPPRKLSGVLNANTGSTAVKGKGTRFLSEIDVRGPAPLFNGHLRLADDRGVMQTVKVASVDSDTDLTLASPWKFSSVVEVQADTYYHDSSLDAWNYDLYYRAAYYDTALVEYINYYRTGDPAFLGYSRKIADSWWGSQWIDFGTVTAGPEYLPPRAQAFAGLILRALDGKPEYWDYLYRTVRATFDNWLKTRRNYPTLYYDIREDGYAQLYAVMLAKALPDKYLLYANGTRKPSTGVAADGAQKRKALLADAEDIAVNFFGRLQKSDGSWRNDVNDDDKYRNIEQPFMTGLYLESVVLLHQLSSNGAVKQNLATQLTKSVAHLYNDAYEKDRPVTNLSPYKWRAFYYYWGGGTESEPNKFSPPHPRTLAKNGTDEVASARQGNSTLHHAFGYAYVVSGDTRFRSMGDDLFGASFGDSTDAIRNFAASAGAKEYDQNFRTAGRYLVWRLYGTLPNPVATSVRSQLSQRSALLFSLALSTANKLSVSLANPAELEGLIAEIIEAQREFIAESDKFGESDSVLVELKAALENARTALVIAKGDSGDYQATRLRIQWVAARLQRANNRLKQK